MKHKITMRFSKKEQELVWKYNSNKTKQIGLDLAEQINKRFKDGRITVNEYVSFKLSCTFEDKSDEEI